MLAKHIISHGFQSLNVEFHCFKAWRSVNTIGPETLIQCAKPEYKFAIQKWAFDAFNDAS